MLQLPEDAGTSYSGCNIVWFTKSHASTNEIIHCLGSSLTGTCQLSTLLVYRNLLPQVFWQLARAFEAIFEELAISEALLGHFKALLIPYSLVDLSSLSLEQE